MIVNNLHQPCCHSPRSKYCHFHYSSLRFSLFILCRTFFKSFLYLETTTFFLDNLESAYLTRQVRTIWSSGLGANLIQLFHLLLRMASLAKSKFSAQFLHFLSCDSSLNMTLLGFCTFLCNKKSPQFSISPAILIYAKCAANYKPENFEMFSNCLFGGSCPPVYRSVGPIFLCLCQCKMQVNS